MDGKKWLMYSGWAMAILFAALYYNTGNKPTVSETTTVLPQSGHNQETASKPNTEKIANEWARADNKNVPKQALKTLEYVLAHRRAPEGYVGGRTFFNREKQLPKMGNGQAIKYQEWDVWPKINGKNRGVERLVTGNNQTAYYTQDHYKSFVQIK